MSALVDDKYWHPDPKMSVIMELKDKVISLEAENARLQKAVDEAERVIRLHYTKDENIEQMFSTRGSNWLKEYGKESQ